MAKAVDRWSSCLPSGGVKKLKNESLGTVLVTVRTVPRPLCFCFFLMVFCVTFLPFVQSIGHLVMRQSEHEAEPVTKHPYRGLRYQQAVRSIGHLKP